MLLHTLNWMRELLNAYASQVCVLSRISYAEESTSGSCAYKALPLVFR